MHRSSESVAARATALARAQIELVNPEKSLTGTLPSERCGSGDRTFRYAPLSSGLDIVRKTLGKHELAVMQTTAVDQSKGFVNLITVLAHSSGEWISSDWPVCEMTDVSAPHRMGAALTYARRYALFTLVGIAGEDDLDAPDLIESAAPQSAVVHPEIGGLDPTRNNQSIAKSGAQLQYGKRPYRSAILTPDLSGAQRQRLLEQIPALSSPDDATQWASTSLPLKNQLIDSDAQAVEQAFTSRIATLNAAHDGRTDPASGVVLRHTAKASTSSEVLSQQVVENGSMEETKRLLGAAPRRRDKAHLKYIATQPCLVCGRQPSDPHHLRFAQPLALGRKVSDEFTVPLCRGHHRELHRSTKESAWWKGLNI